MQNILVTAESKQMRKMARHHLTGKWKIACIATLLLFLLTVIPSTLIQVMCGDFQAEALASGQTSLTSQILTSVYAILITGAITLGQAFLFLKVQHKKRVEIKDAFEGFKYFKKALALYVVISIKTLLWALLFIIPGIIAAIRYSQSFFILAEDNSKTVMQCINESKEMMKGNKGKFLLLNLSFIGWFIVAILIMMVVSLVSSLIIVIFPYMSDTALNFFLLGLVLAESSIMYMVLDTYVMAANAVFYDIASGNMQNRDAVMRTVAIPVPDPDFYKDENLLLDYEDYEDDSFENFRDIDLTLTGIDEIAAMEEMLEEEELEYMKESADTQDFDKISDYQALEHLEEEMIDEIDDITSDRLDKLDLDELDEYEEGNLDEILEETAYVKEKTYDK